MGYLICVKCGGYYELQPDESPEDFVKECECGGNLRYIDDLTNVKLEVKKELENICPKCKKQNESNSRTCASCGTKLETDKIQKSVANTLLGWWEKRNKEGKILTLSVTCFIGLLIIVSIFNPSSPLGKVSISDDDFSLDIANQTPSGYYTANGMYLQYSAYLIPDNDFEYLNMVAQLYDSSGNIIKRDSIWSMNSAKEDIAYKINSPMYIDSDVSKIDIMVFSSQDVSDDSKAIYKKTTTFKG